MVTVTKSTTGELLYLKAHYYYSERIKHLPTAQWHPELKVWSIQTDMISYLENEFDGELFYKTPKWFILHEPMPDFTNLYSISNNIKAPDLVSPYKLYDYQSFGVRFAIDRINKYGFCIIADGVGLGKCHGKGTKILMADGTIKNVEDIKVGEQLMGDDGTPRNVLSLARGQEQMYKITLKNGDSFICNESHILSLRVSSVRRKGYNYGDIVNMSVKEWLSLPQALKKNGFKCYKSNEIDTFNYPVAPTIDPYIYGLWLGDGNSRHFNFTIADKDILLVDYLKQYAAQNNLVFHVRNEKGACKTYCLDKGELNSKPYKELDLVHLSANNGKHILPEFKYGSKETRLKVLAGLLDTDGSLFDNCFNISTKYEQLKDDILFITRSLGLAVKSREKYINGKCYYVIDIYGEVDKIPTNIPRKQAHKRLQKKNPLVYGFTVEPLGIDDYYGFTLDGNHLYLLGDFTVTHNTNQGIGLMIHMAQQGKQKFIIVCKKSIKYQWKEEIEKFSNLGQTFDIFITGNTATKRKKAYKDFSNSTHGILIINYQTFLNDESELSQLQYDFVVIDEAHVVSSHTTKTNKAMTRVLNSIPCLYLTGTPIQSKPEQIFGIVNITSPGYFGSWIKFKSKFVVEAFMGTHNQTIGAKNLDELRQLIQDVMIRRTEYEVSVQLPATVEQQIMCPCDNTQIELVNAINEQREKYLTQYESLQQKYHQNPDHNIWEQMQQCDALIKGLIAAGQATADDPRLFHTTRSSFLKKNFEQLIPSSYKMSSKVESLVDIVENIVDSGDKCIIFSKFTTAIDLIQAELSKKLKINVLTYTGREDDNTRIYNTTVFKTQDEYPVLIGSEAMAEGLNLQVAKYVINFNLPDTAAIYTQRIGRARRVGSAFNNVIVYNLITEGSKDEARWKNIEDNKNLEDSLINIDEAQQTALLNAMNN